MQAWSEDGVRKERTGWRCEDISARHRQWGFNCPAVDLDFVMAEFNHGAPVALIEYKHHLARHPDVLHPTYRALRALADGYSSGPLPFLVVFYHPEDWWFRVTPVNEPAIAHYHHVVGIAISEQRFVKSLYLLRKASLSVIDERTIAGLSSVVPIISGQLAF